LRFALSFDDEPPRVHRLSTEASLRDWSKAVADGVRRVTVSRRIDRPGRHVLKFWMVTPGVVLQRNLIEAGGIRPSYLGPPESPRGAGTDSCPGGLAHERGPAPGQGGSAGETEAGEPAAILGQPV